MALQHLIYESALQSLEVIQDLLQPMHLNQELFQKSESIPKVPGEVDQVMQIAHE